MNVKIAAVVVTYNRKTMLEKNFNAIQAQSRKPDALIVVDNHSTDGTEQWIAQSGFLQAPHFYYLRLDENLGASGGFYEGIKYGVKQGFDWIWGMDDDAIPEQDALEKLNYYANLNPNACYYSNPDNDQDGYNGDIKEVDHWMFVGFFINRAVVEKVGLPRKDFFIYQDDFEYAHRIRKAGFKILKVRTSIIHHQDYSQQKIRTGRFLGKSYSFPVMNDWKIYYLTRNRLLAFSFREIGKYRAYIGVWRKVGIPLLATNPKQFSAFLKGYVHGVLGKSGKLLNPE